MALDLGKQVGPLPLGAWVVVVLGGVGIAYYARQNNMEPEPAVDTGGQPGVGDGTVGGWVPNTPATGGTETPSPTNNEEWAYRAKQHLLAKNYPATTANSAIDKFVAGLQLSVQEYAMVGVAIAAIGAPPQTLPQGTNPPPNPTPQYPAANTAGVKPASGSKRGYGWYRVQGGDTVDTIIKKYGISKTLYYAYNGPARIVAGQYVKVRLTSNPVTGPYYGR